MIACVARRKPRNDQNWIAHELGWAWPKDTLMLYNRASADAEGNPWSERKRYIWWDAEEEKWTSLGDSPDFPPTKAPDYEPPEDAAQRVINGAWASAWLWAGCPLPGDV